MIFHEEIYTKINASEEQSAPIVRNATTTDCTDMYSMSQKLDSQNL
jgi:hypothetical protein